MDNYMQKKLGHQHTTYKSKLKIIKKLKVRPGIIKFLEEYID